MLGAPPTLDNRALSQRQFACLLFGYLSMLAFALYMAGIVADTIAPSLTSVLQEQALGAFGTITEFGYALAFWTMACTTLLSI